MYQLQEQLDRIEMLLRQLNFKIEDSKDYQRPSLTHTEAAKFLNLKESYLHKLCSQRKIPFYKPQGKRKYYNREELEQYLLRNRHATIDEEVNSYFSNNSRY